MDLGLQRRVALVTGAGGGLGSAIAMALAAEGCDVALADVDATALNATVAQLAASGVRTQSLVWDLSDIDAIDRHVSSIEQQLGGVDILINITGGPPPSPAGGQSVALWRKHFESMVLAVVAISDRVLVGMRERKWGRIITSTSSGVVSPIPNLGLSNSLRSTLLGWSKTLSREVAADGVTSNVVVPGRIATPRIRFLDEAKAKREHRPVEAAVAESVATIPVGRYGEPREYADVVAFLASERASYVTGTVIRVDGGLIASI